MAGSCKNHILPAANAQVVDAEVCVSIPAVDIFTNEFSAAEPHVYQHRRCPVLRRRYYQAFHQCNRWRDGLLDYDRDELADFPWGRR